MFDYINEKPEFNAELKFGTLEDYFTELRKQSAVRITYRDLLPYRFQSVATSNTFAGLKLLLGFNCFPQNSPSTKGIERTPKNFCCGYFLQKPMTFSLLSMVSPSKMVKTHSIAAGFNILTFSLKSALLLLCYCPLASQLSLFYYVFQFFC